MYKAIETAKWFLFVSLGGILIGLGGPFWFDTFSRISAMIRKTKDNTAAAQNENATDDSTPSDQQSISDVFKRAAKMNLPSYKKGRILLASDGSNYPGVQL